MTETLLSPEEPFNHFPNAAGRFFSDGIEKRSKENPDLGLFLLGCGDEPGVVRMRGQYDEHIRADDDVQAMFYGPLAGKLAHSTIHRIDFYRQVEPEQVRDLARGLRRQLADFEARNVLLGERLLVGDGILYEITGDDDPVRTVRRLANTALRGAGMQEAKGLFTPHVTDRYAKALPDDMRQTIQCFLEDLGIEPAVMSFQGIYVAVNWPNQEQGTYEYKVIDFIPFAGVEREDGLTVMRDRLMGAPLMLQ